MLDPRPHKPAKLTDLIPDDLEHLPWKPDTAVASLDKYYQKLDAQATKTINWYFGRKKGPAALAQLIRWLAIFASLAGGLFPIWRSGLNVTGTWAGVGDLGYALLATAAALIVVDRFGGMSSAWMRYVTTAQSIAREQRLFRLDWNEKRAEVESQPQQPPPFEHLKPLFALLRTFAQKHDEIVDGETRTWITEFMSVLAELGRSGKKDEPSKPESFDKDIEGKPKTPSSPPPPAFGAIRLNIKDGDRVAGKLTVERSGVKKEWDNSAMLHLTDIKAGEEPQFTVRGVIDGKEVVWIVPATKVAAGETVVVSVVPEP